MSGDFYYNKVSLLLHCDGANNSTTFTDNSPSPKTLTPAGNAKISTGQSKFGGASAVFDGDGDYLSTPNSTDLQLLADFTIEAWVRFTAIAGISPYILALSDSGGNNETAIRLITSSSKIEAIMYHSSAYKVKILSSSTVTTGVWYHLAFCRKGDDHYLFIDGILKASTNVSHTPPNVSRVTYVGFTGYTGGTPSNYQLNGYIDDIRITKGAARYIADFTPPTEAFPNTALTTISTIAITGQTPSLAKGFAAVTSIRQIDFTGLLPNCSLYSFFGMPLPAELAITGQMPELALGYAAAPVIKNINVTGNMPFLAHGWRAAPLIGLSEITGLQPKHSNWTFYGHPPIGQIDFDGLEPGIALGFAGSAGQRQILETGLQPAFANRTLHVIENQWISTYFRCYLIGAQDGLADLELPISSFQTRMAATPAPRAYLSVIVPGIDDFIIGINARPNGRLKVDRIYNYLDGSNSTFAMVNVPFESLSTNQGGKAGTTGTLSGFEESAFITPQTIELFDPITRSYDADGIRYRCRIDPRVRPNDTVIINEESFLIESVIHIIDTKTAIMEIKQKLS